MWAFGSVLPLPCECAVQADDARGVPYGLIDGHSMSAEPGGERLQAVANQGSTGLVIEQINPIQEMEAVSATCYYRVRPAQIAEVFMDVHHQHERGCLLVSRGRASARAHGIEIDKEPSPRHDVGIGGQLSRILLQTVGDSRMQRRIDWIQR